MPMRGTPVSIEKISPGIFKSFNRRIRFFKTDSCIGSREGKGWTYGIPVRAKPAV
jgi:hypothetical protein